MTADEISKLRTKYIEDIQGKFNKIKEPKRPYNKKDVCSRCEERLI